MPVDSESLGSYLRQERERQRVSLQDIAATTKIQLKFLEALESDAYDQLPATPFVVGFLRAYAQYCAIDPEEVLTAYRSLHRVPESPDVVLQPVTTPAPSSPRRGHLTRLGVFLAVFGLIAGLMVHEMRRGQPARSPVASFPAVLPGMAEETTRSATPAAPVIPRPEPAGAVLAGGQTALAASARIEQGLGLTALGTSEAAALPPVRPVPATAKAGEAGGAASPGPLVLQARAMADTWLQIEIDGDKRHSLLLASGKSVQWEAHERFRLTVGNVRGTRLALNGQDIPLQSGRGNVMRDVLLTRSLLR
jgi:cytoskeletal protein RodZ